MTSTKSNLFVQVILLASCGKDQFFLRYSPKTVPSYFLRLWLKLSCMETFNVLFPTRYLSTSAWEYQNLCPHLFHRKSLLLPTLQVTYRSRCRAVCVQCPLCKQMRSGPSDSGLVKHARKVFKLKARY